MFCVNYGVLLRTWGLRIITPLPSTRSPTTPRRESFFTSHLGKYVEDLLTMKHAAEMDERGQRRLGTQQYSQHMRLLHALAFGSPVRLSFFHFTTTLHPYLISNLFSTTSFSFFASSYHTAIMMKTYSRKHHHQSAPPPPPARHRSVPCGPFLSITS